MHTIHFPLNRLARHAAWGLLSYLNLRIEALLKREASANWLALRRCVQACAAPEPAYLSYSFLESLSPSETDGNLQASIALWTAWHRFAAPGEILSGSGDASRGEITLGEYRGRTLPAPEVRKAKDRMGRWEGRHVRMGAFPLREENINHTQALTLVRSYVHPTTSSYVEKI
jgi:hypothetical protein